MGDRQELLESGRDTEQAERLEHAQGERQELVKGSIKGSINSVDEASDSDWWAQSDGRHLEY